MKIAYLTSVLPAASHVFIRREINELRRQGFDVHTFSVKQPPIEFIEKSHEDRHAFMTTYYLQPTHRIVFFSLYVKALFWCLMNSPMSFIKTFMLSQKHRVPGIKAWIWSFFHFFEALVMARELRRRNISHVHNHFANSSATISLLASSYLKLPWSLTLHAHSETDYPAGPLLGAKLVACDFAICISHFMRAQAYRVVGQEHWKKIHIARCGIELSDLPFVPSKDPEQLEPFRFVSVARLSPEKGHIGLLEAFSQVRRQVDAELILVGDGPERKNLDRAVERLGLKRYVKFMGALPEKQTLKVIAESDALVLASFMEGIPVVLMEAMALYKPVIAPHITGIPEMIIDGKNGLLFTPTDWSDLALKMRRTVINPALRAQLASEGRKTIERDFSIKAAVAPLVEIFVQRLISRSKQVLEITNEILLGQK